MHQFLISIFEHVAVLEESDKKLLETIFTEVKIKKGDYFLKEGAINQNMGVIQEGLMRFYIHKDGEEHTLEFSSRGSFVVEYQSFIEKTPSIQYIQAIEDTTLLITNSEGLQKIFNDIENGNKIFRILIELRFNEVVNQLLSVYIDKPEERYKKFLQKFPDLLQRIPQYYIASYVGVKPQSLSRIKKRMGL
jgi:CRP-like cAMP-binding protein